MNPVRLLLVEDDAVSRGFLTLALQSMPATVVDVAVDAAQALAHVKSSEAPFHLWLLDANLPDGSGEELLERMRALRPDTPALCLTAEVQAERLDHLLAAGFAEVLQKPLTIPALHAAVRRVLASARANGGADAPVWDDAIALQALGGNAAAVEAMRGLFVAELPLQAAAVVRAVEAGDFDDARAVLHKLKASCGFVGALRLLDAVHALSAAADDPRSLQRFQQEALAAQPLS
ncbi:MAG TPA: response regulator [Xanthomonadaceae bacterium]|jgi:DNA-binding response OmpR family regulator